MKNHGILLKLHAPWFSRESMEFPHGFSMVFPCFQYQDLLKLHLSLVRNSLSGVLCSESFEQV